MASRNRNHTASIVTVNPCRWSQAVRQRGTRDSIPTSVAHPFLRYSWTRKGDFLNLTSFWIPPHLSNAGSTGARQHDYPTRPDASKGRDDENIFIWPTKAMRGRPAHTRWKGKKFTFVQIICTLAKAPSLLWHRQWRSGRALADRKLRTEQIFAVIFSLTRWGKAVNRIVTAGPKVS